MSDPRIELKPGPSFSPPCGADPPKGAPKRRSIFGKTLRGAGWLAGGAGDWFGTQPIRRGASFTRDMYSSLRAGPRRDTRFKTGERGGFDLKATAFCYGLSVHELEARLAGRRRQTARIAYVTFALAWTFLALWVWRALASPWSAVRVASAINFLPACAVFFLLSLYNALLNFQLRIGRLATWREYLTTTEPFWPR